MENFIFCAVYFAVAVTFIWTDWIGSFPSFFWEVHLLFLLVVWFFVISYKDICVDSFLPRTVRLSNFFVCGMVFFDSIVIIHLFCWVFFWSAFPIHFSGFLALYGVNPGVQYLFQARSYGIICVSLILTYRNFLILGGESGSADSARDPRGFAVKFYTDEGNWDLVGNNTPIFFIRDPILFPSFIHTQKRNPKTHLKVRFTVNFFLLLLITPWNSQTHSNNSLSIQ